MGKLFATDRNNTSHTTFGEAGHALYTLHTAGQAAEELDINNRPITAPYVLGLFNDAGDGLALQGTRRELLTYLRLAIEHVQRETDPRGELDQALRRLHTLRDQRCSALDRGDLNAVGILDEDEVAILSDVAEAAELVNDDL